MNFKICRDTYFFDAQKALEIAREQNTITILNEPLENSVFFTDIATQKRQEFYRDLQICYYHGPKIENGPANFINVPVDTLFDFFKLSRLRYPEIVDFDSVDFGEEDQEKVVQLFRHLVRNAQNFKDGLAQQYIENIKLSKPNFNDPLRIFLMANRHTTVMQYVSKNIAEEFARRGYEIKFSIEQNSMESLDSVWHYKECAEFNPHITININHFNNEYLNDEIFNFVWFQDPMPILTTTDGIILRKRDILYTLSKMLMNSAFYNDRYRIQRFCVDGNIFFINQNIIRENKIIFIGSSHRDVIEGGTNSNVKQLLYELFRAKLYKSETITKDYIKLLSQEYCISYNDILFAPLAAAVRESCVEWICQQNIIKVEVYGRYWDDNPIVKPYYKGELLHGKAVADAYNGARYSLSAHSFYMYQQRLPEMAACGTIPIVYDTCDLDDEEYLYREQTLLFNNYEELVNMLTKVPNKSIEAIAKDMSFSELIKRIISEVKHNLGKM